jgi:hypothetical protein
MITMEAYLMMQVQLMPLKDSFYESEKEAKRLVDKLLALNNVAIPTADVSKMEPMTEAELLTFMDDHMVRGAYNFDGQGWNILRERGLIK